jgi:aldose 1-epimerase
VIELRAGPVRAALDPAAGGRVAAVTVDGTELLVPVTPGAHPTMWGAFVMAPWVGRLAGGRFTQDGITHQLAVNLPPHALHGTVFARPWTVVDATTTTATLRCPLGDAWPLGGVVEEHLELTADALRWRVRLTADDHAMPAEVGWHPWFAATGVVDLHAGAMYERDADGLPTGRLVAPGPRPWDDCFLTTEPVGVPVGALHVDVTSDCDHVVVFDALDVGTAVEPQSGPPDAFHLRPRVLGPGEALERTVTIAWRPRVADQRATARR